MPPIEVIQNLPRSSGVGKDHKRISIKQVDAFTDTPLTGNPAGVVMNAAGLSDHQMQTIAREMSVPETVFVLPAGAHGADLRIRWFTPSLEVPLCGHATIAAFHALAEEEMYGMKEPGTYEFHIETNSGILPVKVEKSRVGAMIFLGLPVPEFVRAGQYKLDLMRLLNIKTEEIDPRLPIVAANYVFMPVRRLHTIFSISPNYLALSQLLSNRNLGGLCVFTTETVERKSSVHSRFFAPHLGINEDPVTGSANGPLGAYLFEYGQVESLGDIVTLIGEQGDVIGRKGRVTIQVSVDGSRVTDVRIGGRAITILDGEMIIA